MRNRRGKLIIHFSLALSLFLVAACSEPAHAQSEKGGKCRDDITTGFKIRSVSVGARYLPNLASPLPKPGTDYSPVLLTSLTQLVHQALDKEKFRENEAGETEHGLLNSVTVGKGEVQDQTPSGGAIGLKLVTSCTKVVEAQECQAALGQAVTQCVDITFHAIALRVDSSNPIASLLNLPRSNRPSFLSNVPGPLLAFNPKIGVGYDRKLGPVGTFELTTNLLDLERNLKQEPLHASKTRLDLEAQGQRSLDGRYYRTSAKLSLSSTSSGMVERFGLDASFIGDHNALGENDYLKNAVRIAGQLNLTTNLDAIEDVSIHAGYRWSRNRFTSQTALASDFTSENSFEAGLLSDGRFLGGITRLAAWADANKPEGSRDGYGRFAALWGYQKEFLVAHNQTVGIETLLGFGRAWGTVPQYARFYGGNSARNFLYEAKSSPVVTSFPEGPILRSSGSGQATAGGPVSPGGTSFWHFNFTGTIPIPRWSSPLVPDISIAVPKRGPDGKIIMDADGPVLEDRPLRVILKNQGETSRKVLERIFKKEGLSAEDAKAKAARELRSINSILGFMADQANIYSVKPMFMFDAARLSGVGGSNKTRFALGGGMQFTIVIAKFEAGYMRSLNSFPGDKRGNFVMRLFFQNLF